MSRLLPLNFFLVVLFGAMAPLRAGIVINMVESGSDVVATVSGSINSLAGATSAGSNNAGLYSGLRASGPTMSFGLATQSGFPLVTVNYYSVPVFPTSFGTGSTLQVATTSTASANMLFRNIADHTLYLDQAYVLGTPVTGTLTWAGKSFATLGVDQGSYLWSWAGDSITLNIGSVAPSPVPEPGTWAAAALLAGGATFMRWRKRAKVS